MITFNIHLSCISSVSATNLKFKSTNAPIAIIHHPLTTDRLLDPIGYIDSWPTTHHYVISTCKCINNTRKEKEKRRNSQNHRICVCALPV